MIALYRLYVYQPSSIKSNDTYCVNWLTSKRRNAIYVKRKKTRSIGDSFYDISFSTLRKPVHLLTRVITKNNPMRNAQFKW